jgi:hypothetical protein
MVRYAKKNQNDGMEEMKLHRFQRRYRGHKLAVAVGASRQDRRHGWGYTKRKSVLSE